MSDWHDINLFADLQFKFAEKGYEMKFGTSSNDIKQQEFMRTLFE
jgi:hypothetical protein